MRASLATAINCSRSIPVPPGSFLSVQYYRRYAKVFAGRRPAQLFLAGAGGTKRYPAYYLAQLRIGLGGGCTLVRNVPVLAMPRGIYDDHFWATSVRLRCTPSAVTH